MTPGFYPWPKQPTWRDHARAVAWFVVEGVVFLAAVVGICAAFLMVWA